MTLKNNFMLKAIELSVSSANNAGGPFGCVIVKDNKIIGSIAGMSVNDWWSDEMHISDAWFYVFPEERKSTVAKRLCTDFIKIAK